ncbi:ABC transporter ATP-binding protein [Anaeromicropila herbilytica]|uniref:ABC transporter ATP-binding protein n=1 Tax=Anaeromicropila herbilytica TaxID=2785025 RepID=A0A7R7EJ11_9FIRM|nr:ABC transporter ATP-binding protein [Anaeromicropila herbilytica]BCN29741.1 ABC transporter ATP-binding protein [Anaeromicropila herbilytica]
MKLVLKNLSKSFEKKQVLKDITFEFEQGKIYGLLGRNGAGKTTLFNCLANELKADSGKAYLITDTEERELKVDDIGYVFSSSILPEFLTGYEFIKFYMDVNKDKIKDDYTINDYFELMKIKEEDRYRLIKDYSHGMKNKIQMLMFIITRPAVILLDEPLTSLDVVVQLEMKKLLKDIHKDHILIFSTHILQLATDLCDEIVALSEGELELLDHSMLKDSQFEEKLVRILKEESSNE